MKRKMALFCFVSVFVALIYTGCTPLILGGAAAGAGAGTYYYINGELRTDYNRSFDQVWAACEKTIATMHGTDVVREKEIAQGTIATVINNEKVKFYVAYKSKNLTTVSIRVGFMGNRLSSQLLHDKIADNLAKN